MVVIISQQTVMITNFIRDCVNKYFIIMTFLTFCFVLFKCFDETPKSCIHSTFSLFLLSHLIPPTNVPAPITENVRQTTQRVQLQYCRYVKLTLRVSPFYPTVICYDSRLSSSGFHGDDLSVKIQFP